MPYLKLSDNQKINYYFHKGNNKIVIAFLHGLGANFTMWEKEYEFFKNKDYSVLSMDLRGHGLSNCNRQIRFNDFSNDLNLMTRKLKISEVILIGHSLGGLIALDFYRKCPNKVLSIILIDSSYKISLKTLRLIVPLEFAELKLIQFFARLRKDKPEHMDFQKFKTKSDLRLLYEANSSLDSLVNCNDLMKDLFKINLSSTLKKIKIPVLIIASTEDQIFKVSVSKKMAKMIPEGHFHIIKGTHSVILKKPMQISNIIESFIKH